MSLQWVHTDDFRYLDPDLYDDVGIVEARFGGGVSIETEPWQLSLRTSLGGGLAYNRSGLAASGRPDLDPFYFRGFIEGIARRTLGQPLGVSARAYLNPFLRSRGALLVREDFHYHSPGGAGVRGADPRLSTAAIVALNLELERTLLSRASSHLFRRVGLAAFTDLSHGIGGSTQDLTGDRIRFLADAGLGVRAEHRIGDTEFSTRFDFPFYVSRPEVAQDRDPGDGELEFRWTFSFEKPF
jgi:hypothetical protein